MDTPCIRYGYVTDTSTTTYQTTQFEAIQRSLNTVLKRFKLAFSHKKQPRLGCLQYRF